MTSWLKKTALGFSALLPVACFIWYGISFLPHLSELQTLSASGKKSLVKLSPSFYSLVVADENKERIRSYTMSRAYFSLVYEKNRSGTIFWHANNALWFVASYFHFRENELFGIWIECALYDCGLGVKEAARKHFGKELENFTDRDLAHLVAVVRSPTRYAPGSVRGEQRANEILARAKIDISAADKNQNP